MSKIDCEIYIAQLINFFESNPNDLLQLIGDLQKNLFYDKLKDQCLKNSETDGDHVITKTQIMEIILELKIPELTKNDAIAYIQKSKWGDINLN